jgi:hypothetical protein
MSNFRHNVFTPIAQNYYRHTYQTSDNVVQHLDNDSLETLMRDVLAEYEVRTMDVPLPSPTNRQLKEHAALREAYEAMTIIMKLQGLL